MRSASELADLMRYDLDEDPDKKDDPGETDRIILHGREKIKNYLKPIEKASTNVCRNTNKRVVCTMVIDWVGISILKLIEINFDPRPLTQHRTILMVFFTRKTISIQ